MADKLMFLPDCKMMDRGSRGCPGYRDLEWRCNEFRQRALRAEKNIQQLLDEVVIPLEVAATCQPDVSDWHRREAAEMAELLRSILRGEERVKPAQISPHGNRQVIDD